MVMTGKVTWISDRSMFESIAVEVIGAMIHAGASDDRLVMAR